MAKLALLLVLALAGGADAQKWTKCIGNEIMHCMSCVLEASEEALKATIAFAEDDEFETIAEVLKMSKTAIECTESCKAASTKIVAKECGSFYCKTDFCVKCCGKGDWQCMGNDWTPQCAPKWEPDFLTAIPKPVRIPPRFDPLPSPPPPPHELGVAAPAVQKCICGEGSGDPDSCCSKCHSSKDPHNVPHCAGGGKNTGPFCGNDFHVTEPDGCYGEKPVCCTNDMGMPVCCRKDQTCHSPRVGNNSCKD